MASRAEQKAAARAVREARLRAATQSQARQTRLIRLASVVGAVALVIVVIVVAVGGGSGGKTYTPKQAKTIVTSLLAGIPQSGATLGNPKAPITLTEYGDLVCPICGEFAVGVSGQSPGPEGQLIRNEVRKGKVKLVYLADETASGQANHGEFVPGQVAALAAGLQHKAWNYILLWYYQQGDETKPYVTNSFLQNLALQIPGLNLTKWQADRNSAALASQVAADGQAVAQMVRTKQIPYNATPTFVFTGPKGQTPPYTGLLTYPDLQKIFKSVS